MVLFFYCVFLVFVSLHVCVFTPARLSAWDYKSYKRQQLLSVTHLWPVFWESQWKQRVQIHIIAEAACVDTKWARTISRNQPKHALRAGDQTQVISAFSSEAEGKDPERATTATEMKSWEEGVCECEQWKVNQKSNEEKNVILHIIISACVFVFVCAWNRWNTESSHRSVWSSILTPSGLKIYCFLWRRTTKDEICS